ncbi:MAG TPA: DUF3801 domain-containing protein [Candidatus Mediterraneibacter guildfordensis]|nr:DUF3801 domain-containing protein [Candidatus Mediterraneibacter guildfordensis]
MKTVQYDLRIIHRKKVAIGAINRKEIDRILRDMITSGEALNMEGGEVVGIVVEEKGERDCPGDCDHCPYLCPENEDCIDGMVDVVVKEEDAPRINRIVERFKFASVTEAAQIRTEIEKSREEKSHRKSREASSGKTRPDTGKPKQKEEPPQDQKAMSGKTPAAPQQERPEKSQEDRLMDELFGEPVKKEGKQQNPSLAKTEKSRLSEPISVRPDKTAEGTSKLYAPSVPKKPSVRKELKEIQAARKKEAESKGKEPISKEKPGRTRQTQHTQPQNRKKPRKSKER